MCVPIGKGFSNQKKRETNSLINDDTILRRAGARPFPLGLIFPRPTFFFFQRNACSTTDRGNEALLSIYQIIFGPLDWEILLLSLSRFFQSIFRNLVHRGWGRKAFTQARGREVGKGLFFFFFFWPKKKEKTGNKYYVDNFYFYQEALSPYPHLFLKFFLHMLERRDAGCGGIYIYFLCKNLNYLQTD